MIEEGSARVRCLGDGEVSCRLMSDDVAMSSVHALLENRSDAAPDGVGWGGGLPPLTVSIGRAPIVNIGSTIRPSCFIRIVYIYRFCVHIICTIYS